MGDAGPSQPGSGALLRRGRGAPLRRGGPRPYARTLLELEARRSRFLPLCSAFNKNALEERIGAIMRSRKTSAAALAVALVLVVALTAVLATNAPGKGRSPPPPA